MDNTVQFTYWETSRTLDPGKILAWIAIIALALGLNLFIFGMLPTLIQSIPHAPDDTELIQPIQVVRIKRPETPPRKKERPKPPDPPEEMVSATKIVQKQIQRPTIVRPNLSVALNSNLPKLTNSIALSPLSNCTMKTQMPLGLFSTSELDYPLQTLVRLPASYPMRARRVGIEGWVKVEFIVTREGRVRDIKVVGAQPKGVFESSVTQSVAQYRFKPGTVDGNNVEVRVVTTIRFKMEA
ncbi:energy transducer TonB [Desulfobacter curvatus]|uniref:energy transducer TonB n=1 Tax=Desulfobacter curvatus TaxID=2290 RepID=UPI000365BDD8|nr:energy transducer TonB [Desulfobacter curvatus]